jgi:hypothetical protein
VARDGALYSRWECKYLIDPRIVSDVRAYIQPFMEPDPYAAKHPDLTYPINSLYLDSPDLRLYNEVLAGERDRFKLRVRCYSDDPQTPVFFEIKKRINRVVHKVRAKLDRERAAKLIDGEFSSLPAEMVQQIAPDLDEFMSYRMLITARPVVRVKYRREAYQARNGEPVRVTFDTGLKHALTFDGNLSMEEGSWVETPIEGVILEIKFTDRFPTWVRDMVAFFRLHQRAVPKYVWSVDQVLNGRRATTISLAGFTLPQNVGPRVDL